MSRTQSINKNARTIQLGEMEGKPTTKTNQTCKAISTICFGFFLLLVFHQKRNIGCKNGSNVSCVEMESHWIVIIIQLNAVECVKLKSEVSEWNECVCVYLTCSMFTSFQF